MSDSDYKDLVLWGGILVAAMLVLFVVQKVIRFGIQSKVRSIHREFAIRPDDLDRMAASGFLSDEERKRINEAIVRNLSKESREAVRSHSEAKVSAEALLKVELERNKQAAKKKGLGSASPAPDVMQSEPAPINAGWNTGDSTPANSTDGLSGLNDVPGSALPPPPDPGQEGRQEDASPSGPQAVDLEALLLKGLITREEYEELRDNPGREL